MFFAHLAFPQRCMIAGALAGVVLELCLLAAFLTSKSLPAGGLRSLLMPLLMGVGGLSLLAGIGAFLVAIVALCRRPRRCRRTKR